MICSRYNIVFPVQEVWKDIKEYEGIYQVSNYGQVRSLDRDVVYMRLGKMCTRYFQGQLLQFKDHDGYLVAHLRDGSRQSWPTVHRLVATAFNLNPNNNPVIDHRNDNKAHNESYNLHWCTVQENTQKSVDTGKIVVGAAGYSYKLSDQLKDQIRGLLSEGESVRKIERDLGVSQRSIARIRDNVI